MTQETQNNIAKAIIQLLEIEVPKVPKYLADIKECFDADGNVNLQQMIGAALGLPEQLEKMAAAAKSYMAVLRDAHMFKGEQNG
ncbi:MAG: hypothetical protein LBL75_01620 [Rickettsiales bacterium]|jgi:hypothetical protein|nr:hypothetical protein [Rickettsiales bacterium]